jgi:hypothetical protein
MEPPSFDLFAKRPRTAAAVSNLLFQTKNGDDRLGVITDDRYVHSRSALFESRITRPEELSVKCGNEGFGGVFYAWMRSDRAELEL